MLTSHQILLHCFFISEEIQRKTSSKLESNINILKPERPEPIVAEIEVYPFRKKMDPSEAIDVLLNGDYVFIEDFYSTGLDLLNVLKSDLYQNTSNKSYQNQKLERANFREISHRILLLVDQHQLKVKKAPEIGWFKILYPEYEGFLLPFPQVQGLNSSWQWYQKGLQLPVVSQKLYPYYGVYFPTRFEHLELFDDWLKKYQSDKNSAYDIGLGCGVLTLQLIKNGFQKVFATDSNTNAIIGFNEEVKRRKLHSQVELLHGDLFANCTDKAELIVFNPPWIPASKDVEGLDKAIYYGDDLFPRFFKEAEKHLKEDGKLILLFSNLSEITETEKLHPIKDEIANGGRFQKENYLTKQVNPASKKTRRDQNWRADELVELWILKHN